MFFLASKRYFTTYPRFCYLKRERGIFKNHLSSIFVPFFHSYSYFIYLFHTYFQSFPEIFSIFVVIIPRHQALLKRQTLISNHYSKITNQHTIKRKEILNLNKIKVNFVFELWAMSLYLHVSNSCFLKPLQKDRTRFLQVNKRCYFIAHYRRRWIHVGRKYLLCIYCSNFMGSVTCI